MDTLIYSAVPVLAAGSRASILHATQYEKFQYDQYDWDRLKNPGYRVLLLTRGYFAIVSPRDYARLARYKWSANIQRDKETGRIIKIYAVRNSTKRGKKRGKRIQITYYLHREVRKAGGGVIVDHQNGWTLDCRRGNLNGTNRGGNNGNYNSRPNTSGLLRGVERRRGGTKFGGVINCNGIRYRSKRLWNIQDPAHRWYCNKHKELFSYISNSWRGETKYPTLPPLKGEDDYVPF